MSRLLRQRSFVITTGVAESGATPETLLKALATFKAALRRCPASLGDVTTLELSEATTAMESALRIVWSKPEGSNLVCEELDQGLQ